jgi:hypothetical protein
MTASFSKLFCLTVKDTKSFTVLKQKEGEYMKGIYSEKEG